MGYPIYLHEWVFKSVRFKENINKTIHRFFDIMTSSLTSQRGQLNKINEYNYGHI